MFVLLKRTVLNMIKNQSYATTRALIAQSKFRAESNHISATEKDGSKDTQTQHIHQVHDLTLREVAEATSFPPEHTREKKY